MQNSIIPLNLEQLETVHGGVHADPHGPDGGGSRGDANVTDVLHSMKTLSDMLKSRDDWSGGSGGAHRKQESDRPGEHENWNVALHPKH